MAGHGRQNLVLRALDHGAGVVLCQLGEHAARQLHRVTLRQCGRYRAHGEGFGRKSRYIQAQRVQRLGVGLRGIDLQGRCRKRGGQEQRLAGDGGHRAALQLGFEPLVDDALMRRVHVDHDQALLVFSQDVDALQLRQRPAQRPVLWGRIGYGLRRRSLALCGLPERPDVTYPRAGWGIAPRCCWRAGFPGRRLCLRRAQGHGGLGGIQRSRSGRLAAQAEAVLAGWSSLGAGSARCGQCGLYRVADRLVDFSAVAKTHLDFGGVHVHIHPRRLHRQVQRVDGLALAVQHVFKSAAGGVAEHLVADKAAVHIGELLVGAGPCGVWNAHAAPDLEAVGIGGVCVTTGPFHGNRARQKIRAEHIAQALVQCGCRGLPVRAAPPLFDQLALVPDGKAHVRTRQRVAAHGFDAVGQLGGVGLEEFAPRRGAVKKLFHLHRGAGCAGDGSQLAGAPVQHESVRVGGAREDGAIGNRVDGGQRLAAKTHGGHRLQVLQAANLAGGVALEGNRQFSRRNAHAVVLYRNQPHAAGQQPHRDVARLRVQRVVHQFAHHRGRALHHFTGRNLADQRVGQFTDGAARGGEGRGHRGILGGALRG